MKRLLIVLLLVFLKSNISFSQEYNVHRVKYIFDTAANAKEDLKRALLAAGQEHKNLLILVGGDWSYQSEAFDAALKTDKIAAFMNEHYVYLKINFSPENKNADVLGQLGCPKYQGYPIIIVLDPSGKQLEAKDCDGYKTGGRLPYSEFSILLSLKSWISK